MRYLSVNGREVKSPVFLASMAGITDVAYVNARAEYIGGAFIGGYNIDTPTRIASMEMNAGGRREFSENLDDIKSELETLCDKNVVLGVNLRGISPDSYLTAAECLGKDIIIEIDAHCRQIPMMQAGAGETLLSDIPRLTSIVSTLHANGFCVSVKWRAGIIDDANLATVLWKAGTDILHLDCMDFGSEKVREIRNACPLIIIGNNGVISADVMTNYFAHGADLVSIARHADIPHLAQLFGYAETLADEIGWYNAPKQICRGGDVRGLAFCCMPMKQCDLLPTLEKAGITHEEYISLKNEAVAGTQLEGGQSTCFGSLAYCCKSSSPCMLRERAMKKAGLSKSAYMHCKRNLSQIIMNRIFSEE